LQYVSATHNSQVPILLVSLPSILITAIKMTQLLLSWKDVNDAVITEIAKLANVMAQ